MYEDARRREGHPPVTRPRVLRVITRLNVGGPATHVALANRGLEDRGWETLLVFGTVEPDEAEIDTAAIRRPALRVPALARPIRPSPTCGPPPRSPGRSAASGRTSSTPTSPKPASSGRGMAMLRRGRSGSTRSTGRCSGATSARPRAARSSRPSG